MLPPSITSAAGVAARRTAASRRSRPPSAMSSNSKIRSVLLDLVSAPGTIGTASNSTIRSLSSNSTPAAAAARKIDPDGGGDSTKPPNHRQDFVKVRLEPGQWDEDRTDPTFRPKWKSKASIISAEDFAARPKAGFGEEFASLHDSMTVLSWLTQADREAIYQMYCELMHQMSNSDRGATSHEYAMRVIAQKFNLTPARVAGIVQLEHEEDRIRKEHPDRKIHYKLQEFVDAKMKEHIADAYRTFGETPPDAFVEDPVGATGYGNPDLRVHATAKAEDLFDMDDLLRKSVIRERDEAQLAIDNHVYIEDVDNDKQDVKVNAECRALMQAKNAATEAAEMVAAGEDRTGTTSSAGGDEADTDIEDAIASNVGAMLRRPDDQAPLPEYGRGIGGVWADKVEPVEDGTPPRRPRWKYAAKIINTRAEKLSPEEKSRKKARARRKKKAAALGIAQDEDVQNTLVEHDARLRPATAEEASNVAWKPVRNDQEFTYQGVKRAWIGHKLRGEKGGWGRVERNLEKEKEIEEKLAAASAEAAVAAAEVEEAEAADKSAGSTGGGDGKRARKYRDIRCFNCGEVGHSAADCPKEAFSGKGRCWNCGEAGHDAKACPKKKE